MHLFHVGYVGLAGNVHYDAVVNFATGWFGIRLLGGACPPEDRVEVAAATERPVETVPAPVIRHEVVAAAERPEEIAPTPVIRHEVAAATVRPAEAVPVPVIRPEEPTTTREALPDPPRSGRTQHMRIPGVRYVDRATQD